jgi:hypothetical protein
MLTLDETTLFYHYRRTQAPKPKLAGVIRNWKKTIEPAAGANSSKTGSGASSVRSTSDNLRRSTTTAASIISDKTVVTAAGGNGAKELEQHDNDAWGGLADELEVNGPEGEFARLSPFKGKKRVTNDVSPLLYLNCLH